MLNKIINRYTCNEKQLINIIKLLNSRNMHPILDYINENSDNHFKNYNKIMENIKRFPNTYFSIKLSSLNIKNDYELSKIYLNDICENAIDNKSKILIDAEDYLIQDYINTISNQLMYKYNIGNTHIFKTYQCYRKDSFSILKGDLYERNVLNYNIGIKLVRGAYYKQDKKFNILYDNIEETHDNYNKCLEYLFINLNKDDRMIVATHNENSCKIVEDNKNLLKNPDILSFAQLMGMGDNLSYNLSKNNKVFKYIPFGNFYESIPYLLRRLYENKDSIKYFYK